MNIVYLSTGLVDALKELPRFMWIVYIILRIVLEILQVLWTLSYGGYDTIIV